MSYQVIYVHTRTLEGKNYKKFIRVGVTVSFAPLEDKLKLYLAIQKKIFFFLLLSKCTRTCMYVTHVVK